MAEKTYIYPAYYGGVDPRINHSDYVGTLDLAPGMIVSRARPDTGALKITEISEPLLGGLAVHGHHYMPGHARWTEHTSRIVDGSASETWYVWDASLFVLAHKRLIDASDADGTYSAYMLDDKLYVHQHRTFHSNRARFPLTWQGMDALARKHMPNARLCHENIYRFGDKWTRIYRAS